MLKYRGVGPKTERQMFLLHAYFYQLQSVSLSVKEELSIYSVLGLAAFTETLGTEAAKLSEEGSVLSCYLPDKKQIWSSEISKVILLG